VQDATNDKGDTVDVFIDDNNGKTSTYQADDAHYAIKRSGASPKGIQARVQKLTDGYLVEAALPLKTAGAIGRQIGFGIRFTDASQPDVPISWNDPTNSQDTDTSKFVTATRIVPGGYVVEASIALDAIQPQVGTLIGFDFQVNDDGQGNAVRSSVVTWNDPTGQSYQNTSRFGVLRFANRGR
jgi:endo-1,4-beta-xylanase